MTTIPNMVRAHALKTPSAPAIHYENRTWTYAELDALGARAATGLTRLGITAGDRVAIWLPNTPAYVGLWLGCARIGAIAVAVNTRFRSVEVADIVARSGARVLAMWPSFRSIPFLDILGEIDSGALARLEALVLYDEQGGSDTSALAKDIPDTVGHCQRLTFDALVDAPTFDADHGAESLGSNMFTTSGTTKAPKFVLHSHGSVTKHAHTVATASGYLTSAGGILQALPLCGVFGFCQATAALAAGRSLLLMSAFEPDRALQLIDTHGVEYLNGTDDMLTALFDATPREHAMPTVKFAGFASFAAEPDAFMQLAESRGLRLVGLYGMSEVQAFFARQAVDAPGAERLLGGGFPLDALGKARVTDPDTGERLPVGQQGEIELAGPSLMTEYFENPEATQEAMTSDGFLKSGDLGYETDDGRFIYLARMGDVLRLGGFLVAPAEIEARLNSHPDVTGAQVVGVPTERGTRPVGFVTTTAGLDVSEAALREHCLAGLAKFKAPDRVLTVPSFPTTKSANGTKIQKAKLREMAIDAMTKP